MKSTRYLTWEENYKKLGELLKEDPHLDIRETAKILNMNLGSAYQYIWKMKKRGILDSNERYGSPRRSKWEKKY